MVLGHHKFLEIYIRKSNFFLPEGQTLSLTSTSSQPVCFEATHEIFLKGTDFNLSFHFLA